MFVPAGPLAVTVCALGGKEGGRLTRLGKVWCFITVLSIVLVFVFFFLAIVICDLTRDVDNLRKEVLKQDLWNHDSPINLRINTLEHRCSILERRLER